MSSHALKDGDFPSGRLTFQPDTENVAGRVDIAIMRRAAVQTFPMPHSKRAHTFRTAGGDDPAARARLGSPSFVDDPDINSMRNRFILEKLSEHRPTGVVNRLRHFRFGKPRRVHIADNNYAVFFDKTRRFDMQEMSSLPRDLGLKITSAALLLAPLIERQFFLGASVKSGVFDLVPIAQRGQRLEPEINAHGMPLPPVALWNLDLDIDVPFATTVGGHVPGLRDCDLRDRPGKPKSVRPAQHLQRVAIETRWPVEIGEWNPVEVALVGSEARRLGKRCIARSGELAADCVNGIGVNAEFFCAAPAQIGKIECGRSAHAPTCTPAALGLAINLATVIPNEVDRARLTAQLPARRCASVSNPVAMRDNHFLGRCSVRADWRSRARRGVPSARRVRILYWVRLLIANNALHPRTERRGFHTGVSR